MIQSAEVHASRADFKPGDSIFQYKPEGKTDDQGRFRFSNLAEGEYRLFASPPWSGIRYSTQETRATAGQADDAEVVIKRVE